MLIIVRRNMQRYIAKIINMYVAKRHFSCNQSGRYMSVLRTMNDMFIIINISSQFQGVVLQLQFYM